MSSARELWTAFNALPLPASVEEGRLQAKLIPGRDADYLAKGKGGEPVILIRVSGTPKSKPSLCLRHISVEYSQHCRVQESDQSMAEGWFVMIACSPENPGLFEFFVRSADALVSTMSADPTAGQVDNCVRAFVELYRKLTHPGSRTIKGLWAELFFIATSSSPRELVEAWHAEGTEKFDFSRHGIHIEIKSTEQSRRIHDFSLEQLRPRNAPTTYIASFLLLRSGGGTGVIELVERIAARLAGNSELIRKLWENVAQSLGEDFSETSDIRFDESYALTSLRILSVETIPCIQMPLPTEVIDVHLTVDISSVVNTITATRNDVEAMLSTV